MALDVYFKDDIAQAIRAGMVLAIRSNRGRDLEYVRGVLALAEHQANTFGLSWPVLVKGVGGDLGADGMALLDQVIMIDG